MSHDNLLESAGQSRAPERVVEKVCNVSTFDDNVVTTCTRRSFYVLVIPTSSEELHVNAGFLPAFDRFFSVAKHFILPMKSATMRIKTRSKLFIRVMVLYALLFVAFVFAPMQLETNSGGNAHGGATQLVTTSTRNVNATESRSVAHACQSSIRNTYAYHLNAPEKSRTQPRPGHWYHFIEFHLPLSLAEEHSNYLLSGDSFNLLLLLPKKSWFGELTPMTRFFLAAVYSSPFARHDVAKVAFPHSLIFLSAENLLSDVHEIKSAKIEGGRASIMTKRSHMWSSMTHQSLLDRFVLNDALICRNADEMVELDTEFISASVVKSGTGFGHVNSRVHEWFATIENAQAMRQSFEILCRINSADEANTAELHARVPRKLRETKTGCLSETMITANEDGEQRRQAVIYQRDTNRKFNDFNQMKSHIKRVLGSDWSVSVIMHDDNNPPCLLYHCLKHAELIITPHGFQSMLTMFLPTGAYMFEIFPSRYLWTGYKALGLMFGVRHVRVESRPLTLLGRSLPTALTTKRCMNSYFCRYLVRKSDVSFDGRSSGMIERIGRGTIMENVRIHPAHDIADYDGTLGACVASCQRDNHCFDIRIVAQNCLHFQNVDVLRE